MPKLSVIQSCYNMAATVEQSMRAVLDQSFADLELIIVDDGSSDGSGGIIGEIADRDSRVRVFIHETNRGMVESYEEGRAHAKGEFIALNACDDIVLPGWAAESIAALEQVPQAAGTFALAGFLNPEGTLYHEMNLSFGSQPQYWDPQAFADTMYGEHWVGNAAVYRAGMYAQAVPAVPDLKALRWEMDSFIGGVLGCRHGCIYLPDRLAAIRVGPGNLGRGADDYAQQEKVILAEVALLLSPAYADVVGKWINGGLLAGKPHLYRIVSENWRGLSQQAIELFQGAIWEGKHQTRVGRWQTPGRKNVPVPRMLPSQPPQVIVPGGWRKDSEYQRCHTAALAAR